MSDRANIKVSREAYERHRERKDQMGLTWEEYLDQETADLDLPDEETIREIVREELAKSE